MFPATYHDASTVSCDIAIDGIRAPAALPVYVTPKAKPLRRPEIARYVVALNRLTGQDLIVTAPAPQMTECRFDQQMIRVRTKF